MIRQERLDDMYKKVLNLGVMSDGQRNLLGAMIIGDAIDNLSFPDAVDMSEVALALREVAHRIDRHT